MSLDTAVHIKRGRTLEYVTIVWNLIEALVSILAGVVAGSASLLGFGVDSLIESASAFTLLWRLREGEEGQEREKMALKIVGISFLILAAYIAFEALDSLISVEPPEVSYAGIAIASLSLIVMPILARKAKRRRRFK